MARFPWHKEEELANTNMMIQSIAADPLPADPHAPVKVPKDQPGSSPWLPGKSPAPSRQQWVKNNNDMKIAQGPDYIGDKLRYGQLDRILNPFNDFRKPTLDQLRIHSKAYPK